MFSKFYHIAKCIYTNRKIFKKKKSYHYIQLMCQDTTKVKKNQFYTRHAHAHTHAHTVQKKATTHQLYSNEQEKHKTTRGTGICRKFPQGQKCWQMPFFLLLPNTDSQMVLEDNSDTLHPSTLVAPHAPSWHSPADPPNPTNSPGQASLQSDS